MTWNSVCVTVTLTVGDFVARRSHSISTRWLAFPSLSTCDTILHSLASFASSNSCENNNFIFCSNSMDNNGLNMVSNKMRTKNDNHGVLVEGRYLRHCIQFYQLLRAKQILQLSHQSYCNWMKSYFQPKRHQTTGESVLLIRWPHL